MKKFFALLVVVMLLAFAGSAFAARSNSTTGHYEWSIGENGTTVTRSITAGQNSNVPLNLTYDGDVAALDFAITGNAANWVTVADDKKSLTVNVPTGTAAGTYQAVVTITDTADTSETKSTQTVTLSITVTAPTAPTTTQVTKVEQVVVDASKTIAKQASGTTIKADTAVAKALVTTTAEDLKKDTATQVSEGINKIANEEVKEVWSAPAKQAEVVQKTAEAVSTPAKKTELFGTTVGSTNVANLELKGTDTVTVVPGSAPENATPTQKQAIASSQLTDKGVKNPIALATAPAMTVTEPSIIGVDNSFGAEMYGVEISGDANSTGEVSSGMFAAEDLGEGVAFVNSSGQKITKVPGLENSQDVMPGYVKMLVVMTAGKVYEPVIYTTVEKLTETLEANGIEFESEDVNVTVNQVVYETKTVTLVNGKDVSISAETLDTLRKALGSDYATAKDATENYKEVTVSHTESSAELRKANLFEAAWIAPMENLTDGAYIAPIDTFNTTAPTGYKITEDQTAFAFRPEASIATVAATDAYKVVDATGAAITPATMKTAVGYLAFIVTNDEIKAAFAMNEPVLVVDVEEEKNPDPTPTAPTGPGDASGGCDAGFAGLALAVLGTFIATRKK